MVPAVWAGLAVILWVMTWLERRLITQPPVEAELPPPAASETRFTDARPAGVAWARSVRRRTRPRHRPTLPDHRRGPPGRRLIVPLSTGWGDWSDCQPFTWLLETADSFGDDEQGDDECGDGLDAHEQLGPAG